MSLYSPWDIVLDCFGDSGHGHLLKALIQRALRKPVFLQGDNFLSKLPLIEIEVLSKKEASIFLICKNFPGIEKFFNEMLSKWLLPGQKLLSHFSMHTTFSFSKTPLEKFSFCEMRFFLENEQDAELLLGNFSQISREIKEGSVCSYQAHKILEHRGLFSSEKNSLIQQRIASLLHKRPENFDYDVFGQMQHFFLSSGESFKHVREYAHLSRIVYIFYLFRKRLKKVIEKAPEKRHVSFKVGQVRLHRSFGLQKVLGVFLGINFLKKSELFEEHHLLRAIQEHLPEVKAVEGSLFVYLHKEEKIQILYLEIEKSKEEAFHFSEVQLLRKKLPFTLENQVEKLMPALFMPRNEEEVMKNVVRLAQELKYTKDIPQVMISFEEQTDFELSFTVILVRIKLESNPSLQDLFKQSAFSHLFTEDRVKHVGLMRGKYPKEATVFRIKLSKALYLRPDHTVDLLKARQAVVEVVEIVVGDFRDYNGGMIAKQSENLKSFKALISSGKDAGVEGFFHSLYPVEMRSVVSPSLMKSLYFLWQEIQEGEMEGFDFSFRLEKEGMALMARFSDEEVIEMLSNGMKSLNLSSSQWMFFSTKKASYYYTGYLLLGAASFKGNQLIESMQEIQNNICFSK